MCFTFLTQPEVLYEVIQVQFAWVEHPVLPIVIQGHSCIVWISGRNAHTLNTDIAPDEALPDDNNVLSAFRDLVAC